MSEKLKRISLCDQVIEQINQDLVKGVYKPGDRLPVENELARNFGVSRNTIREAFKKLSMMGIVDIRQGEGTYIREIVPESFMKPLFPMLLLGKKNLYSILEARILIESKTLELAIDNITEAELQVLDTMLSGMENLIKNGQLDKYGDEDLLFHLQLSKYSQNGVLSAIHQILQDYIRFEIRVGLLEYEAIEKSLIDHKLIVQKIKEKDKKEAVEVLVDHIYRATKLIEIYKIEENHT